MSHYPALHVFVFSLLALFAKTSLTSVIQILSRFRSRRFLLPEDAALARAAPVASESPFVQRCANVWRNDVENLPLFLMLALTYVLLGAEPEPASKLFATYVLIRYAHTIVYLRGLQPWRAMLYLSGMAVCWTLVVAIVLRIGV
ncbi:MAPEG family protein [Undibacterium sp. Jales W-56]|uniref:MAPEG family protein n=1 Tax=Undibacterium sp. Jales W-56 TaxID=2897325 RepID=UPI0021D3E9C5|nr:MAPEG family protein [Undibacterium sp. Jales W-56]MCU6434311.1 MAPEG family protein [Undibacterium sp. Jales W-56]